MYQLDPETEIPVPDDDSLYPYINNDIEYRLFEDILDSYYLDSQIKDDFQCNQDCYTHQQESTVDNHSISCTHAYDHIAQQIQDLSDSTQQHTLHSMEGNASLLLMIPQLPVTSISQIKTLSQTIQMIRTFLMHRNNSAFIHKANTNTETLLVNQIYNTTILAIKTHLHSQKNTSHYYNKNNKFHIGVYTTQLQLKVTKFQKIWTLRLCHMQCTSLAIQTQSQRSIVYHTKQ